MSVSAVGQPHEVLLVDQDDRDIALLRLAITRSRFSGLHVIGSAEQALEFLHHQGQYPDAIIPDLIIIDASRVEQHGLDVLMDVMNAPRLHSIPVIVLSEGGQDALPALYGGRWFIVQRPLDSEQIDTLLDSLSREAFGG